MRTLGWVALLSIGVLVFSGCTSMGHRVAQPSGPTLESAAQLYPGLTTREEVKNLFGPPSQYMTLSEYSEQADDGSVWLYFDEKNKSVRRLTIYFNRGSEVVSSVGWNVVEGDPEQSLEVAKAFLKSRFKGVAFQDREEGWTGPHAYSDMKYFEDFALGVSIFFRMGRSEVSGMTWSEPGLLAKRAKRKQRVAVDCLGGACHSTVPPENRFPTGE